MNQHHIALAGVHVKRVRLLVEYDDGTQSNIGSIETRDGDIVMTAHPRVIDDDRMRERLFSALLDWIQAIHDGKRRKER